MSKKGGIKVSDIRVCRTYRTLMETQHESKMRECNSQKVPPNLNWDHIIYGT